ncbi:aminodeoxychorismate lyase [Salipaludibacillus neizhouensis]|uniref:Endolytic murein transglycosylase n=1 Tax=Salipaludibacillus neizhouensis TaxID=885475 RepID=A0A3A9K6D1_9BACI|nr:endolytic transglycosylase MltG [Salipaludibacillus neizhouensis]RKL68594.1 aminodeoxychorismate lyase [Salipaludibacillus neizhouensis]
MADDHSKKLAKQELKEKHRKKIEEKKKEASMVRKIVLILFLITIIAVGAVGFGSYRYVIGAIGPTDENDEEEIGVTIPIGSTPDSIGEILEEKDLISSSTVFKYYIRFQNESGFQAGDYLLSRSMGMDEIIEDLKDGKVYEDYATSFTIPEGWWIEDIFAKVAEETNVKVEELEELAQDEQYLGELIERYDILTEDILSEDIREPLEGYLFPARYDFVDEEVTATQVIESMLDRMTGVMEEQGIIALENVSFHELLTKASIIEGEASTDEERYTISGVIANRLNVDMPLQMDPTVAYAHGEHLERTLNEDLEIESPYNTYNRNGLPIGPINNPGTNSIIAAMEPEIHQYLYFYHSPDGEVYFTENYSDHTEIVNEYQ